MTVLERWAAFIDRRDDRADRFGAMMQSFGVFDRDRSFTMADGVALERAARRCLGCSAGIECNMWMREKGTARQAERFCPNAETFRKLGRVS